MPAFAREYNLIVYKGSNFLRQRLLLSTLSGKPIRIIEIRSLHDEPGLREFEVNLIRLLDKITNGTCVEINETGTSLLFRPGLLLGGTLNHECCSQRGIGYYLEMLISLGPFCKNPLNVTLRGITNSAESPSVDHIKATTLETLKKFLVVDDGLDLKINKRGMMPLGGGEVHFRCPVRREIRPIQLVDPGMVKRVRGTVYTARVSPAIANRMVDTAKGVLLKFLPDVYINTDQCKGPQAGKSPGFGINLVAETTNGIFYSSEQVSAPTAPGGEPSVPEDLGHAAAQNLLEEIYHGGCTDSTGQSLAALLMALGQKDVSKFLTGPLSEYTISFLQHLREFFGITFKLDNPRHDDEEDDDAIAGSTKVLMTCVGIGYTNTNKRTT